MTSPKIASAERRATLLHAAAQAAKNFAKILDFDELLQKTVDIICEEFDFYYSGVFLIDPTSKWAMLKAGRGEAGAAMIAAGHKLEIGGNSMIGDCIAKKEARISLDVGGEAVFFKNPHLPDTRSEMGLPLIHGDKALGALTVQSVEGAAFTKEDIETLQTMADQLAVAIENARLHQEAKRRAKYFQAANLVGSNLTSILNLDELLPKTVNVICDAYDFYYAGVFLLDENKEWAGLRAGRGKAGEAMIENEHKLEVGGNSMIGDCIANKRARISLDVGEEAVFFKNPHLPDTRSEMGLPLIVGNEVLGAVTIQSAKENAFSEEDISTLQTMADHLAVAIKNAYSLLQLEEAHDRLLRQKTYEALTTATTQAIHWIGNKALPITTTIDRMRDDLKEKTIDVESMQEDLDLIDESAKLIITVKETMLGPAREEKPQPVMIDDIATSAAVYTRVPTEMFEIDTDPDTPYTEGDATQLARVFGHLYQNSLEANAERVWVKVGPSEDSKFVKVTVTDDGVGIPKDMITKIWASFISTKGPGHNGLGLTACLHVITQHEGIISVESKESDWTTFTLLLPTCNIHEDVKFIKPPKKVLIIDDDNRWSAFVIRMLENAGINISRSLTVPSDSKANLILINDAIPSAPIEELLSQLKKAGLNDKTKVAASAVTVERTTSYLNYDVKDVCLKPYSPTKLAEVLG
jgi:GAF domain-containing protein